MGDDLPDDTYRMLIRLRFIARDVICFGVSGDDVRALQQLGQRRSLIGANEGDVEKTKGPE